MAEKHPLDFSTDETCRWVEDLAGKKVADIFRQHKTRGSTLVNLSELKLKEMGIVEPKMQSKLINAVADMLHINDEFFVRDYGMSHYLATIPVLKDMTEDERAKVGASVECKELKKGDILLKQGDLFSFLIMIKEGTLVLEIKDPVSAQIQHVARLNKGSFTGEESILRACRAPASIICESEEATIWTISMRHVRRVLRQTKHIETIPHREAVSAESDDWGTHRPQSAIRSKTKDAAKCIREALMKNLLFEGLPDNQIALFIESMWSRDVTAGEMLISEGEEGDYFYVIEHGNFDVSITAQNGLQQNVSSLGPCTSFGGLALMYNAPRNANVKAVTDGKLWAIHRQVFRRILSNTNAMALHRRYAFLSHIPILKQLLPTELTIIATACERKLYQCGDVIIKKGDDGDFLFIIKTGTAEVFVSEGQKVAELQEGDFFGEMALINDTKRNATVRGGPLGVECFLLSRHAFNMVMGPLKDLMLRKKEEALAAQPKRPIERSASALHGVDFTKLDPAKDLESLAILGAGAFGEVRLVKYKHSEEPVGFALKKISIKQVRKQKQQVHIQQERSLLMSVNNPFVVRLYQTYESKNSVYLLMEVCLGGEMFTYLRDGGPMVEKDAKFYLGCIILAITHIHSKKIVFRDLKPENIIIDHNGYAKITDFGFAKYVEHRTFTLCGTPDYLAPEVIKGEGHSFGVDWWTVGILGFELLHSFPPFYTGNHMKTYRRILREKLKFPKTFSVHAKTLINALCQKQETKRLGVIKGGPERIQRQEWFDGFDWKALAEQKMEPPIIPTVKNACDSSNFDDYPPNKKGRMSKKLKVSDFKCL